MSQNETFGEVINSLNKQVADLLVSNKSLMAKNNQLLNETKKAKAAKRDAETKLNDLLGKH